MTTSRSNVFSYILAGISFALIICHDIPLYWRNSDHLLSSASFIEYLFIINSINVFVQAHGCNKTFSLISAIVGFLSMINGHLNFSNEREMPHYKFLYGEGHGHYSITFYLIVLLLLAQLILPLILLIKEKSNKQHIENTTT